MKDVRGQVRDKSVTIHEGVTLAAPRTPPYIAFDAGWHREHEKPVPVGSRDRGYGA